MTARLPTVAGDDDAWGTVLNTFLGVAHNADGTANSLAVQGNDSLDLVKALFGAQAFGAPVFNTLTPAIINTSVYNAFPSLTYRQGTLGCVYRSGVSHTSVDGAIKLQTAAASNNWSAATTLASPAAGHDLRDPSIVCTATGRLWVNWFDYVSETTPVGPYQIYSDTGFAGPWSSAVALGPLYTATGGASRYFQHSSGVLLQLVWGENSGDGDNRMGVVRSTNDGTGWGSLIAISGVGYDESSMVELANGDLQVFVRNNTNPSNLYTAKSTDVGLTWSALAGMGWNVTPGRPEAVRMPGTGTVVLFYRHTSDSKTYYVYSTDECVTWSAETLLSSGAYMYAGGCQVVENIVAFAIAYQDSSSKAHIEYTPFDVAPAISSALVALQGS